MGIPIDDEPLEPTDDQRVTPTATPPDETVDREAPAADAADQMHEVSPGWRIGRRSDDPEVPEADGLDQAITVPFEDDPDV
jgi:hypothetical protein